jgi:osmotically inducible protein OsmC
MIRKGRAVWQGAGRDGTGALSTDSGVLSDTPYSYRTRFESQPGTNPEELIAAAHAGCFSMALTAILGRDGHVARSIRTVAKAHLGATAAGPTITRIDLATEAEVANLAEDEFERLAQSAKASCLVSRALAGVPQIALKATLVEAVNGQ